MLDRVNPSVIGYALNIVGLFFLASAITFKKPRRQVEQSFRFGCHSENYRDADKGQDNFARG